MSQTQITLTRKIIENIVLEMGFMSTFLQEYMRFR